MRQGRGDSKSGSLRGRSGALIGYGISSPTGVINAISVGIFELRHFFLFDEIAAFSFSKYLVDTADLER